MIEMILDKYILFVLMGSIAVLGIISKFIVSVTLKRLVRAAGNMNKSNHPLMRLVRAKFEHTCMISEKVENVRVFVDKYLYEYRTAGMKLHSWRRMEMAAAALCFLLGLFGAGLEYSVYGMQDMVLKSAAAGAGLAILVFLIHLTTDEGYRLEAIRNYMVDYLENICLHRYEKAYQKELKVMAPEAPIPDFGEVDDEEFTGNLAGEREKLRVQEREPDRALPEGRDVLDIDLNQGTERAAVRAIKRASGQFAGQASETSDRERMTDRQSLDQEPIRPHPGREVPSPRTEPEITPPVMPEPYDVPEVTPPIRAAEPTETAAASLARAVDGVKKERRPQERGERKDQAKDLLIRQILEEFMA